MAEINIDKYFMVPSFEVMIDYPEPKEGNHYKKGEIIRPPTIEYCEPFLNFPSVFRGMAWHEHRSVCELMYIKAIEVITPSYYIQGDKVPVTAYMWERLDTIKPKIVGFYVGGKFNQQGVHTGHRFKLDGCFPVQTATIKVY